MEECGIDEIFKKEIFYINKYESNNPIFGYNFTRGGEGNNGWVPSEETKERMSKASYGIKKSDLARKNMSENHADVSGDKNPNFGKGLFGILNPNFGKNTPLETRKSISESLKKWYSNHGGFKKKRRNSSSIYFGVSKKGNIWRTYIYINKKQVYLGNYKTEIDAAIAYNNYIIVNNLNRPLNSICEEK